MKKAYKNLIVDGIVFIIVSTLVVQGFSLIIEQFKSDKHDRNPLVNAVMDAAMAEASLIDFSSHIPPQDSWAEQGKGPWFSIGYALWGQEFIPSQSEKAQETTPPPQDNARQAAIQTRDKKRLVIENMFRPAKDGKNKGVIKGNTYIKQRDPQGRTALMLVCTANFRSNVDRIQSEMGRLPYVDMLIDYGARIEGAGIDAKDPDGWTALCWASWSGMNHVVELLLKRGADIHVVERQGFTPLMLAAMNGHIEVVQELLPHGCDPATKNKNGMTALDLARHELKRQSHHHNIIANDLVDERNRSRLQETVSLLQDLPAPPPQP